jgi:hypothetical protein
VYTPSGSGYTRGIEGRKITSGNGEPYTPYRGASARVKGRKAPTAKKSRTKPLLTGLSLLAAHLLEYLYDFLVLVLGLLLESGLNATR